MKKFLTIAVVSLLILSVFAACGAGNEMKDDMTTMMDEMTSMLDDMTSDGRGEVTEDEATEDLTTSDITDDETTDITENRLEEDLTEAESKAKNILDDITE